MWVALAAAAAGQAAPSSPAQLQGFQPGFTSYAEFTGSSNSLGNVFEMSPTVGYNLSNHFGVDVGVPMYFLQPSSSTGVGTSTDLGNAFLDLRLKYNNPAANFSTMLTGYAPTGNKAHGLSTGRATFDWTNRFDRSFGSWTPFLEAGVGNTIPDSEYFNRPYATLGFNTHFRGGASYDIWKFFSVGGAAYAIVPSGQQTIFSRFVPAGMSGPGSASGHGVFAVSHETTGSADIARDHGYSAWVDANPSSYLDLELAYTHSVDYSLNTVSFTVGVNVGALAKRKTQP
jgi:hypothetical protein